MSDLNVPFDKVIEIISETVSDTKDEICIALKKLKIRDTGHHHSGREQDIRNKAIADAIQVIKNH